MSYNNINNIIPEIFASIMATMAGAVIYTSHLGFDNYGIVIIKTVLLSYFLIYIPNIFTKILSNKEFIKWDQSKSFMLLMCIIILVFAGEVSLYFNIKLFSIFSITGGIALLVSLIRYYNFQSSIIRTYNYIFFIILGICLTTVPYIDFYYHPLIKEKIITGAWAHRDSVWFPAIAGMFKTYSVSSSGIDGLIPLYYHTLSHYVFGALSGLIGVSTITFFYICAPILISPIFFLSFMFCVKEATKYFSDKLNITRIDENNFKYWITYSIMFLLPLPYQLIGYLGGERYQYIKSSSYNFAFIITFILISLIFTFINTLNKKYYISRSNKYYLALTSIILLLIISLSKVSFLLILGFIYSYIFMRYKFYNNLYHIFTISGFAIVFVIVMYLIIYTETFLFNEAQINSHGASLSNYFIYLLPSTIFIAFKLLSEKTLSLKSIITKIKSGSLIEVEILIALALVLSLVPVQYFKGVQIYLAYIMILSQLYIFELKKSDNG